MIQKVDQFNIKQTIYANQNRYEQLIADNKELPLQFREQLTQVSKLTRLQSQQTSPDKQVIWDTSASVIAPVLFGFVNWCLEQAQKKGIKRLYFVARDGQILNKIAQVICSNWDYDIDCRYFYGSRQAWHAPALQEIGETELGWILDGTTFLSVNSVCERVNIKPRQIESVLKHNGFSKSKWNLNLNRDERNQLREVFVQKEVVDLILATAATYREKAIAYFRQEQLDDGLPFAIVDIGWVGRAQRSFSNLLKSAGIYPESGVNGFYFALEKQRKSLPTDNLSAFYDLDKPNHQCISLYRHVFELFVTADHGGTMGYKQQENQYAPVLRYEKNETAIDWGLYILQDAAVEFARQFTTNVSQQDCSSNLFLQATDILIESFIYNPSSSEAKVFGSFLIADDQGEKVLYQLAPAYSFINCLKLLIFGKQPFKGIWFPASLVRSNPLIRIILNSNILSAAHSFRVFSGSFKRFFLGRNLAETL
jgi:predicted HAD superfamily hydrolase